LTFISFKTLTKRLSESRISLADGLAPAAHFRVPKERPKRRSVVLNRKNIEKIAGEPVSRIDQLPIDNTQLVDFAESRFVNHVNLDNKVRIRATTLPQFPSEPTESS